jgi:flagellar hook-associated protein 1 FlgK
MIAQGYQAVSAEYSSVRGDLGSMVTELNTAVSQVAALNVQIRTTLATGGNANELLDQRDLLTTTISALTGASVVAQSDGTVNVLIGGNALVSGGTASALKVSGGTTLDDAMAGTKVTLVWADDSRTSDVVVDGGEIAGALTLLAPEGDLATTAAAYNTFAQDLKTKVNNIYMTGKSSSGAQSSEFFLFAPSKPAALGLHVVPTKGSDLIAGDLQGGGAYDGSIADAIAQLGAGKAIDVNGDLIASPSTKWSDFVSTIAVATQSELQQANLASSTATYASSQQLANSSVDLDEENVNLLMFQTAYQGAARVLTAVDEMLDTLINRTGLVGR